MKERVPPELLALFPDYGALCRIVESDCMLEAIATVLNFMRCFQKKDRNKVKSHSDVDAGQGTKFGQDTARVPT